MNTTLRLFNTLDITTHFRETKFFTSKFALYTTTTLDNATFRISVLSY